MKKIRLIFLVLIAFLPSFVKRGIYRFFFGYRIGKRVKIGFSIFFFFIFSDDIAWIKDNLTTNSDTVYVDHNSGKQSYNDMYLMSLCQHHIIANSSFSWWGAWLGTNVKKIVIAPKQWFVNDTVTNDLIPKSWLRL